MAIDTEVQLLKNRRTKIVATLGPASDTEAMIARLIDGGVNIFRLNLSHGDLESHSLTFERIRKAAESADRYVGIMADLAGPKIRVGAFRDGEIVLSQGDEVVVTTAKVIGKPGLIPSQYEQLAQDVCSQDRILLADGLLELEVQAVDGAEIRCTVVQGGLLRDRNGMHLPKVSVSSATLTEDDRHMALEMAELGVDYLGLSFVRSVEDVVELRAVITETERNTGIVAKFERQEALDEADAIVQAADAVMVARGDLGVELPTEQVPIAQRRLVDLARHYNRPVIVATQMLESMVEHSRPTRAEVSDAAHTVLSGADAVMLSAETATGAHPAHSVEMINRIARQAEGYLWEQGAFGTIDLTPHGEPPIPFGDAVARSMAQLSRDLRVRCIVVISHGGATAATMSSARPAAPVVGISANAVTCRRMSMMWGVIPHLVKPDDLADPIQLARQRAYDLGMGSTGDFVLLVRGFHADPLKNTPSITLLRV